MHQLLVKAFSKMRDVRGMIARGADPLSGRVTLQKKVEGRLIEEVRLSPKVRCLREGKRGDQQFD